MNSQVNFESLIESLKDVIEASEHACAIFDRDLNYLAFNDKEIERLEKTYHQKIFKGLALHDLLKKDPLEYERKKNLWQQTLKEDSKNTETTYQTENGTGFRTILRPIHWNGKVVAGLEITKELSPTISQKASDQEEKYRSTLRELDKQKLIIDVILKNSSDLIFVKDNQSRVIYANQATIDVIGLPDQDVIGHNDIEIFKKEGEKILENDRRIINSKKTEIIEERVRNRVFLSTKTPIIDGQGHSVGLLGISKDVTNFRKDHVKLEEALETNKTLLKQVEFEKSRFEAIINQLPAAVIIGEAPSGKLTFGNQRMNEVWGFPLKESKNIGEYAQWVGFHPDGRRYETSEWPLARSILHGEVVNNEDVEIIRNGERATLRLSSSPFKSSSGEILGGIVICQDVTEFKKAVKTRDEFMSLASHELKTPLTSLKLKTQLLKRTVEKENALNMTKECFISLLDQFDSHTSRLARLVNDMLDISRIRTGRIKLRLSDFDLFQLAKDTVENMKLHYKDSSIDLKAGGAIWGRWDKDRLEQVLINLLTNAINYGEGKPISVKVQGEGNKASFEVTDRGIGISQKNQKIIFEKFERGGISHNDNTGLGLGLFITDQIVKAHRGEITLTSELKEGTTIKVTLPLITNEDLS